MAKYLGENLVNVKDTEFKDFTSIDWAMYFIERFGQFDGGHHKQWVLDQVSRILKGTQLIIKEAKWDNGNSEYRIQTDEPSEEYKKWVQDMLGDYNEEEQEFEYSYDEGIAP